MYVNKRRILRRYNQLIEIVALFGLFHIILKCVTTHCHSIGKSMRPSVCLWPVSCLCNLLLEQFYISQALAVCRVCAQRIKPTRQCPLQSSLQSWTIELESWSCVRCCCLDNNPLFISITRCSLHQPAAAIEPPLANLLGYVKWDSAVEVTLLPGTISLTPTR